MSKTELTWPGKYHPNGQRVEPLRAGLPLQVAEVIPGPAKKEEAPTGWRNKLIWGDNLLVADALLGEFAGRIDLIYIDPPFAVGADFSFRTSIGESSAETGKEPSVVESKTYRDSWGKGHASYLDMLFPRLLLMRDLLSATGTIYVHVGPTVSHYVRCLLEDVFGANRFVNEIIWRRAFAHNDPNRCGQIHDNILVFQKGETRTWNPVYQKPSAEYVAQFFDQYDPARGERYNRLPLDAPRHGDGGNLIYEWRGVWPAPNRTWANTKDKMEEYERAGRIHYPKTGGMPRLKRYESEYEGTPIQDIWTDVNKIHNQSSELLGYNTQKPEALLERILTASSNRGDLVADFFCGSGTTLAVAEKLGRRWIGCDLGRAAIHTTRKRLLSLHPGPAPVEILNFGSDEQKHWQAASFGKDLHAAPSTPPAAYIQFILGLYGGQPVAGSSIHGRKGSAFVHVGSVDTPITIAQIDDTLRELKTLGGRELHVLGWEFAMGVNAPTTQYAKSQEDIKIRLLSIPREVMDRRTAEIADIQFHDLARLDAAIKCSGSAVNTSRSIKVQLKEFIIPESDMLPSAWKPKIQKWSDYIDYWSIDWDFQNNTFTNQWQTYRTRQDRTLALETPVHTYPSPGTYQILIKAVDIYGNETPHLLHWETK